MGKEKKKKKPLKDTKRNMQRTNKWVVVGGGT
jgi:hypothetical protein